MSPIVKNWSEKKLHANTIFVPGRRLWFEVNPEPLNFEALNGYGFLYLQGPLILVITKCFDSQLL